MLVGREIDGESWYTHDFVELLSKQNTDLKQEIERLNNIIEEIIKICEENEYLTLIKDIKRLKGSDKE